MATEMDVETNEDKLENIKFGIVTFILRLLLQMNQENFGKKCKLTKGAISLIEHGISSSIGRNQKRVIISLGVSRSEFYRYMDFEHQMKILLEHFQDVFSVQQSKIEFLHRYWSDSPPMEEKNPVKRLFPKCVL